MTSSIGRGLSINVPKYHYHPLDVKTLEEWLNCSKKGLLIVDVREEDFKGGHIKNALHIPYSQFHSNPGIDAAEDENEPAPPSKPAAPSMLPDLVKRVTDQQLTHIVFYCMYSHERSPASAEAFLSALHLASPPSVYVIEGGFHSFINGLVTIAPSCTVTSTPNNLVSSNHKDVTLKPEIIKWVADLDRDTWVLYNAISPKSPKSASGSAAVFNGCSLAAGVPMLLHKKDFESTITLHQ